MILKNEKGATSVLVIFMMIVLVTLGAFAITSANVNYKFSNRALNWNKMYFDLDSQGEEYLMAMDYRLAQAKKIADEYIENKEYTQSDTDVVPSDMQREIHTKYLNASSQEQCAAEILNHVYMYYASLYLEELQAEYELSQVYQVESDNFIDSILIMNSFISDDIESNTCNLNVTIWVEPAESNPRFSIEDWYEYQESQYEEPTMEIWDGSIR